jgi:hypothetical protein
MHREPPPTPTPGPEPPTDDAAALDKLLDASLTQLEHQVDSTKHYLATFEPSVPPPAKPPR